MFALPLVQRNPNDNLRDYASKAILPKILFPTGALAPPKMPEPGHKSHRNLLHVRKEEWRKLLIALGLKPGVFREAVMKWQKFLPNRHKPAVADASYWNVTAPSYTTNKSMPMKPHQVDLIAVTHVGDLAFATAQSIIHTAFPESQAYGLTPMENKSHIMDRFLWNTMFWRRGESAPTPSCRKSAVAMVIITQPPWVLSPRDMEVFTKRRRVGVKMEGLQGRYSLKSNDKVWAKLWDTCSHAECPFFVVTSYEEWVFGVFTEGWTRAVVSEPIKYDSTKPTVVQTLCYWMQSALGGEGGFKAPAVLETIDHNVHDIPEVRDLREAPVEYDGSQQDSESDFLMDRSSRG
ncbi:hypothetical protein SISSUDRAFT_1339 [Sistotremastrum suecicum HHB10207 ss-3]|uniref:Uncharacterized protein n=1 Tax=Sistotremastrum suecicum HHB10207 ss-3 TaxID=1314776 RepID=A0A166J2F9_9AGAM|nr:hypothetical protein SISSUDRAFT_1339 [Sistotremastrum suecicum HHB10207 ss-3]